MKKKRRKKRKKEEKKEEKEEKKERKKKRKKDLANLTLEYFSHANLTVLDLQS